MKRLIAAFLRHRSAWQLVALTVVSTSVALWMSHSLYQSTLRMLRPVLIVLWALAGLSLVLALVRRGEDIKNGGDQPPTWWRFLAAILGLAGLISFVTISLAYHGRHMIASCNASLLANTLAEREADLAAAEASLRSPFALLPRLLDDSAVRECERSRKDLDRAAQGLCTHWTIAGLACRCGAEQYPYARCAKPNCLYEGGTERFDCPGDPVP